MTELALALDTSSRFTPAIRIPAAISVSVLEIQDIKQRSCRDEPNQSCRRALYRSVGSLPKACTIDQVARCSENTTNQVCRSVGEKRGKYSNVMSEMSYSTGPCAPARNAVQMASRPSLPSSPPLPRPSCGISRPFRSLTLQPHTKACCRAYCITIPYHKVT